jgi:hypothetical protein
MNAIIKFVAIVAVLCLAGVSKAQSWGPYYDPYGYYDGYYYWGPLSQLGWYEWSVENREEIEMWTAIWQAEEARAQAEWRRYVREEQAIREGIREASVAEDRAEHLADSAALDDERAAEAFDLIDALRSGAMIRPVGLDAGWVAERMDEAEAMLLAGGPLDGAERLRLAAITAELRVAVNEQQFDDFDQRAEAMHVVVLLEYVAENADSMLLAGM